MISDIQIPVELLEEIVDALPLGQCQRLQNEAKLECRQIPANVNKRRLHCRKQLWKCLKRRTRVLNNMLQEDVQNKLELERINQLLADYNFTCRMLCNFDYCNCWETYKPLWADKYEICKKMHAFLQCWHWKNKADAGKAPCAKMLARRQYCADYIQQYETYLKNNEENE